MPLPVRPHHHTAPLTRSKRVLNNAITAPASDPCLEFLSEESREAAVREPIFTVEPIPSEPPRHVVELRTQDQFSGRKHNVSLRFLHPRTALLALHRGVVGTVRALCHGVMGALLALYRGLVGAFLALYRAVLGTLLALYRGVVGAVLALYRGVVGALLSLYRGVVGALLALYRGIVGALLALHRGVVAALLALRHRVVGVFLSLHRGAVELLLALRRRVARALVALYRGAAGTLVASRRIVVGTLVALHRGVSRTYVVARRTTSEVAHWTWSSGARAIQGTTAIGKSGRSRLRRVGGDVGTRGRSVWSHCGAATMMVRARLTSDVRTIDRVVSLAERYLLVVARSLYERCRVSLPVLVRNTQRIALARPRLWMRNPLPQRLGIRMPWGALKISQVRAPVVSVMVMGAFTGGTAVGALVMWLLGFPPGLPRVTDTGVVRVPNVVAWEPSAGNSAATVYAATLEITPVEQKATAPPFVATPMAVMPPEMTVVSTPAGARVTVDGIGWGETPVKIRHLPPGPKVVRVTKEGYESQQRIVSVPGDRRSADVQVTLRAPSSVSEPMVVMPAAMTVTSTPTGARVTVDGIGWGETPVTIRHLAPGQRAVRVTKEGYESQQRTVRVANDGRPAPVRVTLRADD